MRQIRFGRGEFAEVHGRVAASAVNVDAVSLPTDLAALEVAPGRELRAAATDSDPETGFGGGTDPANWQILMVIEQALAHPLASPKQRSARRSTWSGRRTRGPCGPRCTSIRRRRRPSRGGS